MLEYDLNNLFAIADLLERSLEDGVSIEQVENIPSELRRAAIELDALLDTKDEDIISVREQMCDIATYVRERRKMKGYSIGEWKGICDHILYLVSAENNLTVQVPAFGVAVRILLLPHYSKTLRFPEYTTRGSAGMDLRAACPDDAPVYIAPRVRRLVPTGISIALPNGYEGQVRSRSGLALEYGICVLNSPGTIDSDYRGEIHVLLQNVSEESYKVRRGELIAQLVVSKVRHVTWEAVDTLPETARGQRGLGSTGR